MCIHKSAKHSVYFLFLNSLLDSNQTIRNPNKEVAAEVAFPQCSTSLPGILATSKAESSLFPEKNVIFSP